MGSLVLFLKLRRDIWRQRWQFLAATAVLGIGVAVYVAATDAYANLEQSFDRADAVQLLPDAGAERPRGDSTVGRRPEPRPAIRSSTTAARATRASGSTGTPGSAGLSVSLLGAQAGRVTPAMRAGNTAIKARSSPKSIDVHQRTPTR